MDRIRLNQGAIHPLHNFINPLTREEVTSMAQVILGEDEGIESALRRFKRQVSRADIFADMKKNRHFETPLQKAKRKALARRKKRRFSSN
jgi:small subunit ribosomal protein S21